MKSDNAARAPSPTAMAKSLSSPPSPPATDLSLLDHIKRLAVMAMFSDDELMQTLVLKGGNAMALIHRLTSRESVDLDFSMADDFEADAQTVGKRIEHALQRTFQPRGFEVFDARMEPRPANVSEDLAAFWGGYQVEFKVATSQQYEALKGDLARLRTAALDIGQGKRFLIDISRFEYVKDKEEAELDGFVIYVYSPLMIACEKLRAVCQQMDEYAAVVRRRRPASERARDFLDIHTLVDAMALDLVAPASLEMIRAMFMAKRVDVRLLGEIERYREFHRAGWPAVQATVAPGVTLRPFDFYADWTVALAERILARLDAAGGGAKRH